MNIMEQPHNQNAEPKKQAETAVAPQPAVAPAPPAPQSSNTRATIVMILVVVWVLSGLIAFIYSLYCFSKSGTTGEKILGLLLSMLIGPFYFIYLYVSSSYCK